MDEADVGIRRQTNVAIKEFLRADEAANALAKGALKGARGNSGVITSQLLRGFAKSLNGVEKTLRQYLEESIWRTHTSIS